MLFRSKMIVYAVLETGGKQYRVQVGDRFRVERLAQHTAPPPFQPEKASGAAHEALT